MSTFQKIVIGMLSIILVIIGYYFFITLPEIEYQKIELEKQKILKEQEYKEKQILEDEKEREEKKVQDDLKRIDVYRVECEEEEKEKRKQLMDTFNTCVRNYSADYCAKSDGIVLMSNGLKDFVTKCIERKNNY